MPAGRAVRLLFAAVGAARRGAARRGALRGGEGARLDRLPGRARCLLEGCGALRSPPGPSAAAVSPRPQTLRCVRGLPGRRNQHLLTPLAPSAPLSHATAIYTPRAAIASAGKYRHLSGPDTSAGRNTTLAGADVAGAFEVFDALSIGMATVVFRWFGENLKPSGAKLVEGRVLDLLGDGPLLLQLYSYFRQHGRVYNLVFGPKSLMVVSDPRVVRHILRDNATGYSKGLLAEILKEIMGKGLIPADYDTWKVRRRALLPGFHKAWLNYMAHQFAACAERLADKLDAEAAAGGSAGAVQADMEERYLSVALDIIGVAVFNTDFDSVDKESPIIKAVYGTLQETEHRATFFLPYWDIPVLGKLVPRQARFQKDLAVVNDGLNAAIKSAFSSRVEMDEEALQARDYANVEDASLLRFLVDLRGEDSTATQLRDDLMTLLVAGHETTASVLTWATFALSQDANVLARLRDELDTKLGGRAPTYDEVMELPLLRRVLAETLRLYPAPPLLIRRALEDDPNVPGGLTMREGQDIFIGVWNIHRDPELWEDPEVFDPDRWLRPAANPGVEGWGGYNPPAEGTSSSWYPNEVQSDYAFLPFGAGPRKCIGDQFAMLEAIVTLATIVQRFDFELACEPGEVGLTTGATLHTAKGLPMRLTPREGVKWTSASEVAKERGSKVAVAMAGAKGGCPVAH